MFRIILALLLVLIPAQGWCVTQWTKTNLPATGDNLTAWPTAVNAQWSILDTLLSNYRRGYNLGYSSGSTLSTSPGEIVVSNSGGTVRLFLQDAGSGSVTFSNIDTGVEANSTTYYVYCGTSTATDAACTYYISLSSSAPTGVTYYARLGSFYNDASGNITSITNDNAISGVGSYTTKTAGVTYQALTDGYVSADGEATSTANMQIDIYSDSSSSPTTVLRTAKLGNSSLNNVISVGEIIKKGDYYKVVFSNVSSRNTIKFYPLGS